MGDLVHVKCADCGHADFDSTGRVMRGYIVRCSKCGETKVVENGDLVLAYVQMEETPGEVDLDLLLQRQATQAGGACPCGGAFTSDAPIRCRNCQSAVVQVDPAGSAD